jgi:cysteine sulfinate desulfinase/cysteine desulfurase-like protein
MTSMPDTSEHGIDLGEAARQLELAVHDAQVAYDCMSFGNLDRAHTYTITARAAVDAAETILRTALGVTGDGGHTRTD